MATTNPDPRAIVVGGGPGGLMAAEVMARAGVGVTVFEHRASVGRKFLLAGRGGLNITHTEPVEAFLDRYGSARPWLESSIHEFSSSDLRAWCAGLGEPTFVGTSGRVFPQSFRATPLLRAWLARLDDLGVDVRTRHRWTGWAPRTDDGVDARRARFVNQAGDMVEAEADVTVLALGGASWPRVSSDGAWVTPMSDAGVVVRPLRPANCGVAVGWTEHLLRLAGTPLKNVSVAVEGNKAVRGDVMITRSGLEGGPIYAQSAAVRAALDGVGRATLSIDVQPDLTVERLTERFLRRRSKDSASTRLARSGLRPEAVALVREATSNRLPSGMVDLARLVKNVPIEVADLMPIDRAISSAGGVDLDAVDDRAMVRCLPGVFLAGEMLDWEAPTGGYLLQATFSTAVRAAHGALDWLSLPT